jgi:hypothetical protein
MKPKWRRWLAVVAIVGAASFLFLRGDSEGDLPRLVFLRQEHLDGRNVAVFRLDSPKHGRTSLGGMSTQDALTGEQRKPMLIKRDGSGVYAVNEEQTAYGTRFFFACSPVAETASPTVLKIISPPDDVWRLRCDVIFGHPVKTRSVPEKVLRNLRYCWEAKTLALLTWEPTAIDSIVLESEFITNAVPPAAPIPSRK